jgi:hypothetical protein
MRNENRSSFKLQRVNDSLVLTSFTFLAEGLGSAVTTPATDSRFLGADSRLRSLTGVLHRFHPKINVSLPLCLIEYHGMKT